MAAVSWEELQKKAQRELATEYGSMKGVKMVAVEKTNLEDIFAILGECIAAGVCALFVTMAPLKAEELEVNVSTLLDKVSKAYKRTWTSTFKIMKEFNGRTIVFYDVQSVRVKTFTMLNKKFQDGQKCYVIEMIDESESSGIVIFGCFRESYTTAKEYLEAYVSATGIAPKLLILDFFVDATSKLMENLKEFKLVDKTSFNHDKSKEINQIFTFWNEELQSQSLVSVSPFLNGIKLIVHKKK